MFSISTEIATILPVIVVISMLSGNWMSPIGLFFLTRLCVSRLDFLSARLSPVA